MKNKKKGPVKYFQEYLERKNNTGFLWLAWTVKPKFPILDLKQLVEVQPMTSKINEDYYISGSITSIDENNEDK